MSSNEMIKKIEKEIKTSNDEAEKFLTLEKEFHQKYLNVIAKSNNLQEVLTEEKKKISTTDLESQFKKVHDVFSKEIAEHVALAAAHLQTAIDISEREGIQFKSPVISLIELEKYCELDHNYDTYVPTSTNKKWGEISAFLAREYRIYDEGGGWLGVWMPSSMRC